MEDSTNEWLFLAPLLNYQHFRRLFCETRTDSKNALKLMFLNNSDVFYPISCLVMPVHCCVRKIMNMQ